MEEAEVTILIGYLADSVVSIFQMMASMLPLVVVMLSALVVVVFFLKVIRSLFSVGSSARYNSRNVFDGY